MRSTPVCAGSRAIAISQPRQMPRFGGTIKASLAAALGTIDQRGTS